MLRLNTIKRRWKVSVGFVVVAALIGIGAVPLRRSLTVRFNEAQARKPARSKRAATRRKGR